jgi:hypothetical protein
VVRTEAINWGLNLIVSSESEARASLQWRAAATGGQTQLGVNGQKLRP